MTKNPPTCPCCKRLKLNSHEVSGKYLDFYCSSCGASFDAEYIFDLAKGEVRLLGHQKNPDYVNQFSRSEFGDNLGITPNPAIPQHLKTFLLGTIPMQEKKA